MDFTDLQEKYGGFQRFDPNANKQKGKGGFATSLISEGGAAGGAALGTAFLPGVGTVIGAGLGGLIGRLTENKVRDDEFRPGQAFGEGLTSGAFSAVAPAFKAVKGARAASKAGGSLDDALQAAGKGFNSAPKSVVAEKLAGKADDFSVRSFRFTPSQLTKIKKQTGVDAGKIIKSEGLIGKNADDVEKLVSGLNEQFGALVTNVNVPKSILQKNLKQAYEPLLKSSNLSQQRIGQQIQQQADEILKGGRSFNGGVLNNLKQTFDADTNFTKALADPDRADLSQRVGSAIRESLREASGDNQLKSIGQRLQKLQEVKKAAIQQSNLGRGSQAIGLTDLLAGGAGGAAFGLPGAAATVGAKRALNSPTAQRGAASVLSGASNLASGQIGQNAAKASSAILPQAIRGTIGAATTQPALEDTLMQQGFGMQDGSDPTQPGFNETPYLQDGISGPLDQQTRQPIQQSPYGRDALMFDIQRDPANAAKYIDYFKEIDAIFGADSQTPEKLTQGQQQFQNNAVSALKDIGIIRDQLSRDPSIATKASVPGGGLADRFLGTGEFEAARSNVVDALARLRSGAAITEDEARRYAGLLPSAFDRPELAASKLQRLEQLLSTFANPVPASQGTLEDALLQSQGAYN